MGRCVAKLSRRTAERIYSMPLHCQTWLFHCSSRLHGAPPFNSIALPCTSVHCLCCAFRRFAVALLNDSRPFRCKSPLVHALPLPFPSEHFLRFSLHFSSLASLRAELLLITVAPHCCATPFRCVTGSPPRQTCLFRCCATGRCRRIGHSPAIPGRPFRDRRRGRQPGTHK